MHAVFPGQQELGGQLVADGQLGVAQRGELVFHLRLQAEAVPEDQVRGAQALDVLGGGLMGVRVPAWTDHGGDVHVGGDVGDGVGEVAGGGVHGRRARVVRVLGGATDEWDHRREGEQCDGAGESGHGWLPVRSFQWIELLRIKALNINFRNLGGLIWGHAC